MAGTYVSTPEASVMGHGLLSRFHAVHQYGPRKLWDEVEAAHCWWVDQGRPAATRWQVTVTPEQQRIELISP